MPAFDLSGMYKDLAESIPGYGNVARGAMQQQELMNRDLEYQKAKEDFEAQRGLRALFAKNPNASIEEAAQYSPAFAQELMKNRFAMQKDLLNMEETKQKMEKGQKEMSEMDRKIVSETLGPIAEHALITGDMEGYKQAVGRAASELKSRGINLPMNFDPAQHTPDAVLRNATGGGYKSPLIQQQMDVATQQQLSQVPGRPSGPSVQMTPEGYALQVPGATLGVTPYNPNAGQQPMFRNPPTGTGLANPNANAGPPNAGPPGELSYGNVDQSGMAQKPITPGDVDLLRQQYQSMKAGPQKEIVGKMLADAVKQTLPGGGVHADQGQTVTPQELATIRQDELRKKIELETAASGERKVAELEATRKDANKQAINGYFRLRPPQQISNLIRESIQGGGANKINELANLIGVSIPGATPTSALSVIAQQMVASKPFPPGSQSEKELEARMKSIGDPSSSVPAEQRLAQFDEWLRDQEELIAQEAELTPEELIDKVSQGYISKETAAKVYKRMHRGK